MTNQHTPGMTVEEGNKLICQFMGWRFDFTETEFGRTVRVYYEDELRWIDNEKFLISMFTSENGYGFHLSWEKLMPVAEKIVNMTPIKGIVIQFTNMKEAVVDALIRADRAKIWASCVQFIQWLNQQKQ